MHKKKAANQPGQTSFLFWILLLFLIAVFVLSMVVGRYPIRPLELLQLLLQFTGISITDVDSVTEMVFWQVRLPRAVIALLIGAALSVSGASYQGILRNPIVAPDILGASSGASLGAAIGILFGLNAFIIQFLAFACGLAAVSIAFFVSKSLSNGHRSGVLVLVLTGMVITSLFSAGISIIKYIGDPYDTLPALTFWLMGGLTYVKQLDMLVLIIPFLAGMIPLMMLRWKMNLLCFSDEEAGSMGIEAGKTRGIIILLSTLLTCSAVAIGGMIGWVGLVIPHICRMLVGPDYKKLLPLSFLAGALFLMVVDDVARCISMQELPLGVLTAIIGAPVFLYLLGKGRRSFLS